MTPAAGEAPAEALSKSRLSNRSLVGTLSPSHRNELVGCVPRTHHSSHANLTRPEVPMKRRMLPPRDHLSSISDGGPGRSPPRTACPLFRSEPERLVHGEQPIATKESEHAYQVEGVLPQPWCGRALPRRQRDVTLDTRHTDPEKSSSSDDWSAIRQSGPEPGLHSGSEKILGSTLSRTLNSEISPLTKAWPSRLLSVLVAFLIPSNSL